ncbi:hypothetical protein D3C71_1295300 [compost metagenome]
MEVDRQIDDERPKAEVHPDRARQRPGEVAVPEHREVDHRVAAGFLGDDEPDETGQRQADDAQRHRAPEAQHRALRDEQHQAEDRDGKRQDARDVQRPHLGIARFLHRRIGQGQGDHRQCAVNQEHPFPARQRQDGAAHDRTEAQPDAEDDAPPRKRRAPFASVAELAGQDRDLADQHHRGAKPLEKARHDQHPDVVGQSAYQRRHAEGHDADHEQAFASVAVGQRSGRHQDGRHRDGVGGHHPLELAEAGSHGLLDRREDRRHAGYFQAQHQSGKADSCQGKLAPA